MTPQELRNSILQLAIQGKLAAQKPNDWKHVRFGDTVTLLSGTDFKPDEYNDKGQGTPYITGASSLSSNGVLVSRWTQTPRNIAERGDVLLVCKGSGYGKTVICDVEQAHIARQIMAIKKSDTLNMKYVQFFLMANLTQIKAKGQGIIPGIDRKSVLNLEFPFPPLAEQKRIVAKIEELLPYIDRYEQAWMRLEQFNKKFPVDMQKSILQMAIQGKLVEQCLEESTADELYQQIQAEKQRLIKEGKIKKETPLPEITEDEVPFDIPDNWKWVRLSSLAVLENGDRSTKYPTERDYVYFGVPFFGAKDMDGQYMSFGNVRYISKKKFEELGNGKLQNEDFICLLRGSVGKISTFKADEHHQTGFICAQMVIIRTISLELNAYLRYFLNSPYYLNTIESKVTGTAVRQLPAKELAKICIPLPPLAEQKRIVARLEELLPLCERLNKKT